MRPSALTALLVTLIALPAGAARAELVVDRGDVVALFFVEDGVAFRAVCADDTLVFDHASCDRRRLSVAAAPFLTAFASDAARPLPGLERAYQAAATNLQRVDARFRELLDAQGGGDGSGTTWSTVEAAQRALAQEEARAATLRDQLARMDLALGRAPNDLDVLQQRALAQAQLADRLVARNALQAAASDAMTRYAATRASASDRAYRDLVAMRRTALYDAQDAREGLATIAEHLVFAVEVTRRLLETGFAWRMRPEGAGERAILDAVWGAFASAELDARTFTTTVPEVVREVRVRVTDDGRLRGFACRFAVQEYSSCRFALASPGMTDLLTMREGLLITPAHETTPASGRFWESLVDAGLHEVPAKGDWTFRLVCDGEAARWPDPHVTLRGPTSCTVTLGSLP